MKGVIFTTDAIFSLIITITSISILLSFNYYTQASYALHYSDAQAVFSNLAATSVGSLQGSSAIAKAIATQALGANESWPQQLGGPQRSGSNPVGPLYPILLYTYNPWNTITTGIVADYGNIYFAANNVVYAVNATTNRTAWTKNVISNVVTTPALYSGMLLLANATNVTALSARTGAQVWTNAVGSVMPANSPMLVYGNMLIFSGSDKALHAYYANNGTLVWSSALASPQRASSTLALGGGIVMGAASTSYVANIVSVAYSGTSAGQLVATNIGTGTNLAGSGAQVYFGSFSGSTYYANAIYVNGSMPWLPVSTGSQVTGVAVYRNYIVYQALTKVVALSPTGSTYWSKSVPSSFGIGVGAGNNATPVISGTTVYTLWPEGLAAQNLSTGAFQWFALLPNSNTYPYMTLAYGKLFLTANNIVRAYGSCAAPLYSSLLAAAATMYLNSQGGCASALLNSVYPMANYTVFVGNPTPYSLKVASFNGAKGYIMAHNSNSLNNSYVSTSFWVNVSSYPASGVRLVNYGDNTTTCATVNKCGWFFYLTGSGIIQFYVMNGAQKRVNGTIASGGRLNKNTWYMITGVLNGTNANLYINSGLDNTTLTSNIIASTTPNINLTIGAGMPSDARYFTGNIANLQVYSRPYGPQQVGQLYREGIGGVPIRSAGLVAWFPLAGDSNDYALFDSGFLAGSTKFATITYTSPALSDAYEVTKSSTLLPVLNYSTGASNTIRVGVYSWS